MNIRFNENSNERLDNHRNENSSLPKRDQSIRCSVYWPKVFRADVEHFSMHCASVTVIANSTRMEKEVCYSLFCLFHWIMPEIGDTFLDSFKW